MLNFLTFLPIVGPIFQSLVDAWGKHEDIGLQKQVDTNKTDVAKTVSKNQTDVSIIQSRAAVVMAFKDDMGSRLIRDLIMFPVGVHTTLYYWCKTFPQYAWAIQEPAQAMQYIPYAVIAFLFATAYRG